MKAYWGSGGITPWILWPRHKIEDPLLFPIFKVWCASTPRLFIYLFIYLFTSTFLNFLLSLLFPSSFLNCLLSLLFPPFLCLPSFFPPLFPVFFSLTSCFSSFLHSFLRSFPFFLSSFRFSYLFLLCYLFSPLCLPLFPVSLLFPFSHFLSSKFHTNQNLNTIDCTTPPPQFVTQRRRLQSFPREVTVHNTFKYVSWRDSELWQCLRLPATFTVHHVRIHHTSLQLDDTTHITKQFSSVCTGAWYNTYSKKGTGHYVNI
jgi:hypothetical protein